MVSGGNGSLAGAACLARETNLRVIGVPATLTMTPWRKWTGLPTAWKKC
jgi:hypothetical protein